MRAPRERVPVLHACAAPRPRRTDRRLRLRAPAASGSSSRAPRRAPPGALIRRSGVRRRGCWFEAMLAATRVGRNAAAPPRPSRGPAILRRRDPPPPLRPGDRRARRRALPSPFDPAAFERGLDGVSGRLGLVRACGRTSRRGGGYLAGDDARRLEEWREAVADPEARAIFCARGGYGAMRLLPAIDPAPLLGPAEVGGRLLRRDRAPRPPEPRRARDRARPGGHARSAARPSRGRRTSRALLSGARRAGAVGGARARRRARDGDDPAGARLGPAPGRLPHAPRPPVRDPVRAAPHGAICSSRTWTRSRTSSTAT